jgi:hypothetical protein
VFSGTLASKKSKTIPKRHSRTRKIKRTEITEAKGKKVDKRQTHAWPLQYSFGLKGNQIQK